MGGTRNEDDDEEVEEDDCGAVDRDDKGSGEKTVGDGFELPARDTGCEMDAAGGYKLDVDDDEVGKEAKL